MKLNVLIVRFEIISWILLLVVCIVLFFFIQDLQAVKSSKLEEIRKVNESFVSSSSAISSTVSYFTLKTVKSEWSQRTFLFEISRTCSFISSFCYFFTWNSILCIDLCLTCIHIRQYNSLRKKFNETF